MEDLDFGSLFENFEKEQSYLSAEKEQVPVCHNYYSKMVKFNYSGDNLPVFLFVYDYNDNKDELYATVIKSYCPEYYPGEKVTLLSQFTAIVGNFDVVEHKNNPEILF
jgi:hypothetical protein